MKIIVIYTSGTGFTERYARWIAEELGCEAVPLKSAGPALLQQYDGVIYGGWVMAGKISGLDKLKKMKAMRGKRLAVFAVGATPADSEEVIGWICAQNLTEGEQAVVPFFYFEGGFNFDRMGFVKRKMINMMRSSLQKRPELSSSDVQMMRRMKGNYDGSSREFIEPLVSWTKEIK